MKESDNMTENAPYFKPVEDIEEKHYDKSPLLIIGLLYFVTFLSVAVFVKVSIENVLIIFFFTIVLIAIYFGFLKRKQTKRPKIEEEQKAKKHAFEEEQKAKQHAFEEKQKARGLIKFIDRFGNTQWGAPEDVEKWRKADNQAKEKERLINRIVYEIENFKPSRKYGDEYPYQIELVGYLKSKFPNADIEIQKGSSRPDIVIGNIAIEIKGPTTTNELKTIADKCMRYYQHFEELIIVLFEVNVYERNYAEWKKGIETHFPRAKVIRK